jgi:ABC-2 type transport system ATP-binding protein
MAALLETHGLTVTYGGLNANDDVNIAVQPGQVCGLIGPNGAGKTTFVKAVATLLRPDAGSLHVAGIDAIAHPDLVRRVIGLAGQNAAVEPALTGRENLVMIARLFGHDSKAARAAADSVLDEINLTADADRQVKGYSGGMRRRLDLGASLVGAPKILLLDEPTTGLDPRTRMDLWDSIRSLVAHGTDVLLTTQYLEEADRLADRVAVIDGGRVIAEGTSTELKDRLGEDVVDLRVADASRTDDALALLRDLAATAPRADSSDGRISIPVHHGAGILAEVVRRIDGAGLEVAELSLHRPSLDDVFLSLTGRSAEAAAAVAEPAPSRRRFGRRRTTGEAAA